MNPSKIEQIKAMLMGQAFADFYDGPFAAWLHGDGETEEERQKINDEVDKEIENLFGKIV